MPSRAAKYGPRTALKNWEVKNGFKPQYVAEKLGLNLVQYAYLKKGTRNVTLSVMYRLRENFNVDPITLLKCDNEVL